MRSSVGLMEWGHLMRAAGRSWGRKWGFYIEISLIPNYPNAK